MRIFIRPPDGTKKDDVEMDLNVDELIESVRKRIQDKKGMDAYKLMHKGITMKDDRTLRSYDVPQDAVLMVQSQYHGQYLPMGVTPAMEKRKAEDLEVEPLAPEAKRAATAVAEQNLAEANISWVGVGVAAHGEKGMRRQMEDEHLICPSLRDQVPSLPKERDFACFAIFDGHGGKQVAGFIKTYLAVEIGTAFAAAPEEGPLSDKKLKLEIGRAHV